MTATTSAELGGLVAQSPASLTNDRIYDAGLGRFLQPDPLVQSPDNAQSWNAYTYVFNNPLAYTDPTGMFTFRQLVGIAIAVIGTLVAPQAGGFWAKLGYAMAIGFASGYVATGTFKGGVIGAFSAGITMGIANAGGLDAWQKVGLQATTGGVVESLSGGKFGHGFVSAGVTASVMPQVGHIGNDAGRTVVGALVGGTLSKATGGKFANGAVSGAIQGAMSKRADERAQTEPYLKNGKSASTDVGDEMGGAYLDQAKRDFYSLRRSGDLPAEFGFLTEIETRESAGLLGRNPALSEYLDATYYDVEGYAERIGGDRVSILGYAEIDGYGYPNKPIRFFKGSMTSDRLENLKNYGHEVLHRNPKFAQRWIRATSQPAHDQIHREMDEVIDRIRLP